MKKLLLIPFKIIILILLVSACGTGKNLHTETYKGKQILVGEGSRKNLLQEPYNHWFTTNYNDYTVDNQSIEELKKHINDYNIKVILGTWCGDSQEQTPALFKILDKAGYTKRVPLIFVPRKYKEYKEVQTYHLARVPTIILYKDGQEKGRIIEYPMETLEKDLLQLITGHYKHELDQ